MVNKTGIVKIECLAGAFLDAATAFDADPCDRSRWLFRVFLHNRSHRTCTDADPAPAAKLCMQFWFYFQDIDVVAVSILWFIIRADRVGAVHRHGRGLTQPSRAEPADFACELSGKIPGQLHVGAVRTAGRQDPGKRVLAYKSRRSYGIKSTIL